MSKVDSEWVKAVSTAIVDLPDLEEFNADVSFIKVHDSIADFVNTILSGKPNITILTLKLTMIGLNDEETTALGEALLKGKALENVFINTRLNEEDDEGNMTGVGAGALTSSLSQIPNL